MNLAGWPATWIFIACYAAATFYAIYRASRTLWRFASVVALSAVLFWPLFVTVNGDISRVLPGALWSDSADGKDQIILASIASTFLLPLLIAALIVLLVEAIQKSLREKRQNLN